jgi:alkanesulfonate monooxygenase SsuD/methylene tetrahydromethanopterin reductase-like flavin-dependent oxidoreductase (luciferase family)
VKAVTPLDMLSGGRAWLGIGAGYHGEEAQALGLPLPPVAERSTPNATHGPVRKDCPCLP